MKRGVLFILTAECDVAGLQHHVQPAVCGRVGHPFVACHRAYTDSDSSPYCLGSLASRVTINGGNAILRAARQAKAQILDAAAQKLNVPAAELEIADGKVRSKNTPAVSATLPEVCRFHIFRHGGEGILVHATYDPPPW